ncbi:hypothetical protein DV515_00016994 [Chloebia gouldiae]|uniref:U2A'/phosphoprotein 32 family A C-terminal domain-containing protein n=1 Tax=Chloebia gouldiae TaxID=44316 RepID=A0A3L8R9Q7_CHLGU|nr:hypothetical protein DV515_00016994 [Chloebia gouldiae]
MAEQGDSLCGAPEELSPGVTLNDSLVSTRSRCTGPLPTGTIRLDREQISSIGRLRRLQDIHSLYLQQNQIEKMENLESFPNLRFLCLAGNRIQRVENLRGLPHLSALDLSHNLIQVLDTGIWCWQPCPSSCSWIPSPSMDTRLRRREEAPAAAARRRRMRSCSLS